MFLSSLYIFRRSFSSFVVVSFSFVALHYSSLFVRPSSFFRCSFVLLDPMSYIFWTVSFAGTAPPSAKRLRSAASCYEEDADSDSDSRECGNTVQDDESCYYELSWEGHGEPEKTIWMTAKRARPKRRFVCLNCYLWLQSNRIGFEDE